MGKGLLGALLVLILLTAVSAAADAAGFKKRIDTFLKIADSHRIRTLLVIFDDCWNDDPAIGPQPDPVPGVHNSGWLQSPGTKIVNDRKEWPRLERYVKDLIGTFGRDERVLFRDLHNPAEIELILELTGKK